MKLLPKSRTKTEARGSQRRRILPAALIGILALLVGGLFLGANLVYNGGQVSAPLDDAFIHLQYGRQIGDGQWFAYNDGDPVSTGASSFLYPVLLGAGSALLGLDGTGLLVFAILLGILCFTVAAVVCCELGRRLVGEGAGLWAGALVATNGALVWGATSGMEVTLLAALLSSSLLAFVYETGRGKFVFTPLLLTLTAITRPEGLVFAAILTAAVLFILFREARRWNLSLRRIVSNGILCLLPLAAGAGQLLFYQMATGTTAANGVQAKSILYRPVTYPMELAGEVARNTSTIFLEVFAGLNRAGYLFPGAIFFILLGISYLIFRKPGLRAVGVVVALSLAVALPSVATLGSWNWHHYRYVLPFFPILLLMVVVGIYALSAALAGDRWRRWISSGIAGLILFFSVSTLPEWVTIYGKDTATVRDQQVTTGRWINENLPPEAVVGVNDAGALRYYGRRPVVDLVGLVTNGLAVPHQNGMGSLYEALENMEPARRPDYFVVYNIWVGGLVEAGIFGETPIKAFDTEPLSGIVADDEVFVHEADWTLARSGELPKSVPQEEIKDSLDVADLESEETHGYTLRMSRPGLQPESTLDRLAYANGELVADGGRRISGSEAFTVSGLTPRRPLKIVTRTTAGEIMEDPPTLQVRVDGQDVGAWTFEPATGDWQEPSFEIPARYVRAESVRVEVNSYEPYAPFHYWFVQ